MLSTYSMTQKIMYNLCYVFLALIDPFYSMIFNDKTIQFC